MVVKQDRKLCTGPSDQYLYKHGRDEDSSVHLSSFEHIPKCIGAYDISCSLGEEGSERGEGSLVYDSCNELLVSSKKDCSSGNVDDNSAVASAKLLSKRSCDNADDFTNIETCKRPLRCDEPSEHTSKRSRHFEYHTCSIHPELSLPRDSVTLHGSDAELLVGANTESDNDANTLQDLNENSVQSTPGNFSNMHTVSVDDVESEPEPPSSEYIEDNNLFVDGCSPFVDNYPPRKHVAVGPDHQVEIPEFSSQYHDAHYLQTKKFMGTCIIPMPGASSEIPRDYACPRQCVSHCGCSDRGSVRCVGQHVAEARERIRWDIGQQKFEELGFLGMGEHVALKWTEEEEHVFHEVVFANPASLGKNFWSILSQVFPTKSSKDFVSYYFNVFMLRKRSEQNRSDPMNADSDNDEWQETEDEDVYTTEDCEEDSVVDFPIYQDQIVCANDDHEEVNLDEQDDENNASDDHGIPYSMDERALLGVSEGYITDKAKGDSAQNNSPSAEHDFQDDSCTSYEVQHSGAFYEGATKSKNTVTGSGDTETINKLHFDCRIDGLGHLTETEYCAVHCEPKPLDSYFNMTEKVVDFLPTCNVIEEVFGKGTRDNATRNGQGGYVTES